MQNVAVEMLKQFMLKPWVFLLAGLTFTLSGVAGADSSANVKSATAVNQSTQTMDKLTFVKMQTNYGDVTLVLNADWAPKTVANFVTYVNAGFYDGTIFHRVINDFMIQGGGFTEDMSKKTTRPPVHNEADKGPANDLGTIAMARTSDPHSATAQFFINTKDNTFLNHKSKTMQGWGYAVFGRVVDGMDIVQKIESVSTTGKNGMADVPSSTVVIEKMTIVEKPAE